MFASLTQGLGACDEQARMIQSAANERGRTHGSSIGHRWGKVNADDAIAGTLNSTPGRCAIWVLIASVRRFWMRALPGHLDAENRSGSPRTPWLNARAMASDCVARSPVIWAAGRTQSTWSTASPTQTKVESLSLIHI